VGAGLVAATVFITLGIIDPARENLVRRECHARGRAEQSRRPLDDDLDAADRR
jgi:hypothetical protein